MYIDKISRLKKIEATSKSYAKPIHESFINKIYDKIMSFEKLGITENGWHIIIIFITATTETYAKTVTNLHQPPKISTNKGELLLFVWSIKNQWFELKIPDF